MLSKIFPLNEGPTDRVIRVVVGIVLIPVGLWVLGGVDASVAGVVVAAVGLLPLLTGATGRCVAYVPFRFSTVGGPHRLAAGQTGQPAEKVLASAGGARGGDTR